MKFETQKALIYKKSGIVRVEYKEAVEIELKDVKEHIKILQKLSEGKPVPVLVDGRKDLTISPEAREYASSKEFEGLRSAQALLVGSLATKLIANFYINFHKPPHPAQIFADEKEAVEWLKGFL